MTDSRDDHSPGDHGLASLHLPASDTGGSHLAHWPPRQRGHEHRPVHAPVHVKHQAGEPTQHAKPRGLGLTRSAFSGDEGG